MRYSHDDGNTITDFLVIAVSEWFLLPIKLCDAELLGVEVHEFRRNIIMDMVWWGRSRIPLDSRLFVMQTLLCVIIVSIWLDPDILLLGWANRQAFHVSALRHTNASNWIFVDFTSAKYTDLWIYIANNQFSNYIPIIPLIQIAAISLRKEERICISIRYFNAVIYCLKFVLSRMCGNKSQLKGCALFAWTQQMKLY